MYSTLLEFVQGIESDNPGSDLAYHFDQVITLYRLVGGRSDIDICTEKSDGRFGFSILLETEESAKALNKVLNQNHFTSYNKTFQIDSKYQKSNCLFVSFN